MMKIFRTVLGVSALLTLAACSDAPTAVAPALEARSNTLSSANTWPTPLLVVTVRAQGSNRFGHLYWSGSQPSVPFNVFRNGRRITTVSGSSTGNIFYTDSVRNLRGTFTYQVCYRDAKVCSNSITVVYSQSTETIRYAPECPTTGTATCIVTLE